MKMTSKAVLFASAAIFSAAAVNAQGQDGESYIDDPEIRQLRDQNVDANQALIDALRRAAAQGPVFRLAPRTLSIELETDQIQTATIRVTNTGDELGKISGINLVGSIPKLDMETTCVEDLPPGDFCEINVTYESGGEPRSINTALVGTINENERSNFEVPVNVIVTAPPPPPQPVTVDRDRDAEQQNQSRSQAPQPRDIARGYFGALGPAWGGGMGVQRGFTIVSAPKDPRKTQKFAGVGYDEVRIERVSTDERYDEDLVPWTEASLPVNRDRILTADRVIKAVLETPVSNVMCNKVVATVESDVYSATSEKALIQAGSRVVGQCQDFVDERVGIAWTRIITTDGRSISFRNAVADTNDATGLGGAPGRVYMSPFDKYVLPIFSTMIDTVAGVVFATFGEDEKVVVDENGNTSQDRSAENEGLRIVTEEARGTAQEIISDIRDTREVAVIPKGTRIDIEIMEDIYFKETREVVRLADMRFDLEEIGRGAAERDLPENLTLVPAGAGYSGPTVTIGGRAYMIEEADVAPERPAAARPGATGQGRTAGQISPAETTMNDIRSSSGGSNGG